MLRYHMKKHIKILQETRKKQQAISSETTNLYTCKFCNETFNIELLLMVHMQNVHTKNIFQQICSTCGNAYKRATELLQHINAVHI